MFDRGSTGHAWEVVGLSLRQADFGRDAGHRREHQGGLSDSTCTELQLFLRSWLHGALHKVAVRARPLNQREKKLECDICVAWPRSFCHLLSKTSHNFVPNMQIAGHCELPIPLPSCVPLQGFNERENSHDAF